MGPCHFSSVVERELEGLRAGSAILSSGTNSCISSDSTLCMEYDLLSEIAAQKEKVSEFR